MLARALQRPSRRRAFTLVGLHDRDPGKATQLARLLRGRVPVLPLSMLIRRSALVIEAASAAAAPAIVARALRARRDVLAMSAGGLLPRAARWRRLAARGGRLVIPSGAIAGLDGIKAARCGTLRRVVLTTRKPPAAFPGIPRGRRGPVVLFRGSAARAVRCFPQNINVAATLALAGLGATRTRVTIIADPAVRRNIHEIKAEGSFGRLTVRVENIPSRQNPKTSELAILSALATIQQLAHPWRVGT